MKKIVLIYGFIIGVILCANMFFKVNLLYTNTTFKGHNIVGYASIVVMFSLIYFGVRNYRDKQLDGSISLGKAFKMGTLIALAASTIYVVIWLFYYYLFLPDYIDVYVSYVQKEYNASDLTAKTAEMINFKEMYKNPLFVILITYSEVLPIGLVVALVSALILKKT
jgi:Protein of unknown function (DUF4199)